MKTIILSLLFLLTLAGHTTTRAGVLPPDAVVGDKTIAEWSAEWWKWVFPIPISQNPMLDTNGSFAAVGQPDGDVFFVAGVLALSPGTVTRHFTVPEGKHLFFPLLMYEADNVDTIPPLRIEDLREQAADAMNDVLELHASIDGVEVPNLFDHRAITPVFNLFYTNADNVHTFAFGHPIIGLIDPMVCDGYWLMVEPLPLGQHVLNFGGAFRRPLFFPADIVDYITVVPVPLEQKVEELIAKVEAANLPSKRIRPLLAILSRARDSFDKGKLKSGAHHLRTFQHMLQAKVARLDEATAAEWNQAAQEIIDRANSGSKKVRSKKKSLP